MLRTVALTLTLLAATAAPAAAQGWAEKMFKDGLSHDFGTVPRGAQLFHRFTITNIYAVRMEITKVNSGCGCVTATPAKRVLEPREATTLDVSMDARRFTGAKSVTISVSVGPEYVSTAEVKVSANSRADVVFNPGEVNFGSVTRGQAAEQTIDVEYAGTLNWTISDAVVGKDLPFEAKVAEWYRRPGQVGYKIKVTLKADAPVGAIKEFIYLKTNDPGAATAPVLVEATVQAAVTATPAALSLGAVKTGEALTRRVVVRGGKPFKILGVEAGDGVTAADLATTPAAVQTVTLKCQFNQAGDFKREVKIKTDLQETPVVVVVEGSAAP
jgi:hypothetical protein